MSGNTITHKPFHVRYCHYTYNRFMSGTAITHTTVSCQVLRLHIQPFYIRCNSACQNLSTWMITVVHSVFFFTDEELKANGLPVFFLCVCVCVCVCGACRSSIKNGRIINILIVVTIRKKKAEEEAVVRKPNLIDENNLYYSPHTRKGIHTHANVDNRYIETADFRTDRN